MTEITQIQERFEQVLPRIRNVLRFRLRRLHGEELDEATAEALAICWQQYLKLTQDGRSPDTFVGKIAEFAAKGVLCGGRLAGQERVGDVLSPVAQHERGVVTEPLDSHDNDDVKGILGGVPGREPDPAQQGLLNAEISEWLKTLDPEHQQIAAECAGGLTNAEIGRRHGYSRGWGYLRRKELKESCPMLRGK